MHRILALAAVAALALAAPALAPLAHAEEPDRTLTLTGTGEVSARPDIATIDIGVASDAKTAREALDANNASMRRVMNELGEHGIDEKDVQTRGFNVEPRYHYAPNNEQPPRLVGYRVSNTVHLTVRALDRLGEVLDAVVTQGSNTINGLAFAFSRPDELIDEARRLAGADARRKAELYAEGLGVTLRRIIQVSEAGGGPAPAPMMMRMAAAEASAVPVAAGEQTVSASINVTWELE